MLSGVIVVFVGFTGFCGVMMVSVTISGGIVNGVS